MAVVTVFGANDPPIVSIPFTSDKTALVAQNAADVINNLVLAGTLTQFDLSGSNPTIPAASTYGGDVVTAAGGEGSSSSPVVLPSNYVAIVDNTNAPTFIESSAGNPIPPTVISGDSGMTFTNLSSNAQVFFGTNGAGEGNSFIEGSSTASGAVYVDEASLAFINASTGTTTVNAYYNSVTNVEGGGSVTVNAVDLSATVFVSGSSTVPVDINALQYGLQVNMQGGAALINPGSADVTVFGNGAGSGSATVYGANSLVGGTSALTVTGGTGFVGASGYFVGGSGGDNLLSTSTVPGATTLIGSQGTDTMYGFASGDTLKSTSGVDLIYTFASGDTLYAGTGSDTIYGANTGNNTFVLTGGLSTLFGAYGSTLPSVAANLYIDSAGGSAVTINDFRSVTQSNYSVKDTFEITDGATIASSVAGAGSSIPGETVTLTDGTKITFNYTTVTSSDFKFG